MRKTRNRGFTLIELLVVIAIMGVLASVVLASLNAARDKGADAAIVQSINNMRGEAELFFDTNLSYIDMCDDAVIQNALARADELNKTGTVTCVDGADVPRFWAIEAQLVASTTLFYCVDNDGKSLTTTNTSISNTSGSEDAVCGP